MVNNMESSVSDIEQKEASITNSNVPEEGFWHTMAFFSRPRWQDALQSFSESCCGRIKAIYMLITLPCYTVVCPVLVWRPHYKLSHSCKRYLFLHSVGLYDRLQSMGATSKRDYRSPIVYLLPSPAVLIRDRLYVRRCTVLGVHKLLYAW